MKVKKNILFAWFALCLMLNSGFALAAFDEFVIEQENEFGGQTTEYSDFNNGTLRGVIYYGSDNTKVKEEIEYNEKSAELYGLEKKVVYYFSGVKTQEESYYTYIYSNENLTKKMIKYFDKYNGKPTKTEKFFIKDYFGYNVTYYKKGIRDKVEWFYPSNIEGIRQQNAYFGALGVSKKRVEYLYTEKTASEEGYYKSIYFLEEDRKVKQIWFYNKDYEKKNRGIVQRIDHFYYAPLKTTLVTSNFFDREGILVQVK